MFSLTEFITKHISIGAEKKLSEIQFMEQELEKWLSSSERQLMIQGERYYNGDHDILQKKRIVHNSSTGEDITLDNLPNNKIVDNQYRKMVNQKKDYLLGKPMTITADDDTYLGYVQSFFHRRMMRMMKNLLGDSINGGKGWLYIGYDEAGELSVRKFKPWEIKPFWADAEHTVLEAAMRVYDVYAYEGSAEKRIQKVEIYDLNGIRFYERDGGSLIPCEPYELPYMTVSVDDNIEGYNWSRIPLICFKCNESELPLIASVKSLQDGINKIESEFQDNMEEDARNTILVLVNYDGQDLGEFRKNLATYGAVKVRNDASAGGGDVKTLQVAVNAENYKAILKVFKDALIENAMGYDAKDDRLSGNPNQMNIQSMYSDIDLDADEMETEYQASIEELLWFLNCHLANRGRGDWSDQQVEFTFNRNVRTNEAEIITNIRNSVGLLSNETLIAMHPYVDDVQAELQQIEEEKNQQMDDMGFLRAASRGEPDKGVITDGE